MKKPPVMFHGRPSLAGVAKLENAADSKSASGQDCGFEPRRQHSMTTGFP